MSERMCFGVFTAYISIVLDFVVVPKPVFLSDLSYQLLYALTVSVNSFERQQSFCTPFVYFGVERSVCRAIIKLQPAESRQVLNWGVCCAGAQRQHHAGGNKAEWVVFVPMGRWQFLLRQRQR